MVAGRHTEARSVTVTIPSGAVTTKALTSNVATLTLSVAHPFVVGQPALVVGVDATFNGTHSITAVTSTTLSYAVTAANVASVAATGTVTSTPLTAPAGTFNEEDAGRGISGAGIPTGTTVVAVASDTAATMSAAATAAGTNVAAALAADQAGLGYGFRGWSPESDAESETYTVAAVNAGAAYPGKLTNDKTSAYDRRARS
jgi:type IV secretory pathway protease TraF